MSNTDTSEARNRTRAILHITAGVQGEWEPTEAELGELVKLFNSALDTGEDVAVVATRLGVNATVVHLEQPACSCDLPLDVDFDELAEAQAEDPDFPA